jgi:predicted transcriptional regulator
MLITPNEKYDFVQFRNFLKESVEKYGCSAISKETGIARSTLHRIIRGDVCDIKLSNAHKITMAVKKIRKNACNRVASMQ